MELLQTSCCLDLQPCLCNPSVCVYVCVCVCVCSSSCYLMFFCSGWNQMNFSSLDWREPEWELFVFNVSLISVWVYDSRSGGQKGFARIIFLSKKQDIFFHENTSPFVILLVHNWVKNVHTDKKLSCESFCPRTLWNMTVCLKNIQNSCVKTLEMN